MWKISLHPFLLNGLAFPMLWSKDLTFGIGSHWCWGCAFFHPCENPPKSSWVRNLWKTSVCTCSAACINPGQQGLSRSCPALAPPAHWKLLWCQTPEVRAERLSLNTLCCHCFPCWFPGRMKVAWFKSWKARDLLGRSKNRGAEMGCGQG